MTSVSFKDATEALDISITEGPLLERPTAYRQISTGAQLGTLSQFVYRNLIGATHAIYNQISSNREENFPRRLEWTNATDVTGGIHNDVIRGDGRANTIHGGKGNDLIDGGAGNDRLNGGRGDDVFVFEEGDGVDQIRDNRGNSTVYLKEIDAEKVWFNRDGFGGTDLLISVLGTDQQVRVKDYFSSDPLNSNGHGRLHVVVKDEDSGRGFLEVGGADLDRIVRQHQIFARGSRVPEGGNVGEVFDRHHPEGLPGLQPQQAGGTGIVNATWSDRTTAFDPFANLAG